MLIGEIKLKIYSLVMFPWGKFDFATAASTKTNKKET